MAAIQKFRNGAWMKKQEGKVGYAVAWLLGVPLPILFLVFLLRGCN